MNNHNVVYWPFSTRGFFSELIVFLYFRLTLELELNLRLLPACASSEHHMWSYFLADKFFSTIPFSSSLFSPVKPTSFDRKLGYLVSGLRLDRYVLGFDIKSIFTAFWSKESEIELISKYPSFYDRLLADFQSLFFSSLFLSSSLQMLEPLGLPDVYDSIHLRRGDKIRLNESTDLSLEFILSSLENSGVLDSPWPLIIVSDDSSFASCLVNLISKSFAKSIILNPLSGVQSGHSQLDFLRAPASSRVNSLSFFLCEFLLMSRSVDLLASLTSNVGKALYLARKGARITTLDVPFSIV